MFAEHGATIDDVPDVCFSLMTQLHEQPLQTSGSSLHNPSKALVVDSFDTAKIVEIMSDMAAASSGDRYVSVWATYRRGVKQETGRPTILDVLEYPIYSGLNDEWVLTTAVASSLASIITRLRTGWSLSSLGRHTDLTYQRKDPDLVVFKRRYDVHDMDRLVRFLAAVVLGQGSHAVCDCDTTVRNPVTGELTHSEFLVLFVNRDRIDDVDAFFKFGLVALASPSEQ